MTKFIYKIALSTLLLVWLSGMTIGETLGPRTRFFSNEPRTGYTIWGISPGDSLDSTLNSLSLSLKIKRGELVGSERTTTVEDGSGRRLTLISEKTADSEIVTRIGVFPVTSLFTIERSGQPVVFSTDGPDVVQAALGIKTEDGATDIYAAGNFRIHLTFLDRKLLSAGITLR